MQTFFRNSNSDELILLFCGWGMDEKPFAPLKSSSDILFVFDYSESQERPLSFDFSKYKKITLISFSAGVFMAGSLQDFLPKLDYKVAVNGTLKLFDEEKGLPKESILQMENINEKNYLELRKNLVDNQEHFDTFNKHQPHRDLKSSLDELAALKQYYNDSKFDFDYDKIIIGENDKIIPKENQSKAWAGNKNTYLVKGGHFLFYNFCNFEQIFYL